MPTKRLSNFKKNKQLVDQEMAEVHKDVWFWVEHVAHWHALLFVVILIITFAYIFLNNNPPSFASTWPGF